MSLRRTWFIRQQDQISGPFIAAQISRYLLLGRIKPEDEISQDKEHWLPVSSQRDLYPDVLRTRLVNKDALLLARIQADERMHDTKQSEKERRRKEPSAMMIHRKHQRSIDPRQQAKLNKLKKPYVSLLLLFLVLIFAAYTTRSNLSQANNDCQAAPNPSVNWRNCKLPSMQLENINMGNAELADTVMSHASFIGSDLSSANFSYAIVDNSDFSYADLSNARFVGANLKNSEFNYADLTRANLSYADLTNVKLAGADISSARFDHAIWMDGIKCAPDSVGQCRRLANDQE